MEGQKCAQRRQLPQELALMHLSACERADIDLGTLGAHRSALMESIAIYPRFSRTVLLRALGKLFYLSGTKFLISLFFNVLKSTDSGEKMITCHKSKESFKKNKEPHL